MITLDERKKNRWLMLQKFYELAKGHAGYDPINMWEVGKELGWDRETTEATYGYLQGEGLLKATTLGGGATITHEGVKEVEKAEEHPQEPTLHFPAFIINITGGSETVHGDRIEVGGNVVGSALGRGAQAEARDINVYREAIERSAFDAELKRVLIEAREALEQGEKLSVDDKNDALDDLNKLAQEFDKGPSATRVQRLWNRIKEIAPIVAAILASAVSISKLLHRDG